MRILTILLLGAALAQGQSLPRSGIGEIDTILQTAVRQKIVPGVVAIAETGRVVTSHSRAAGTLVENRNPATIASHVAGDGGLHSTADCMKFLQMCRNLR